MKPPSRSQRTRARVRAVTRAWIAASIVAVGVGVHSSGAATSSTVVSATVPSATHVAPACATGSAATTFGTVMPGANAVTSADCTIQFGSSNDTSMLQLHQTDRSGAAMFSQPFGALDSGYGGGTGTSQWEISGGPADETSLQASFIPDGTGRYYQVGYEDTNETLLARFLANGNLDTSFSAGDGGDGWLKLAGLRPAESVAIAAQVDGSVLVATHDSNGDGSVSITRLLSTGAPDPGYGTGGTVDVNGCDVNASANYEWYYRLEVEDDGTAWLAGTCQVTAGSDGSWVVLRLTPDGELDTGFNGTGIWSWNPSATSWDEAHGLVLDGTGGAYVAGQALGGGNYAAAMVHLRSDGSLDPAFDGGAGNAFAGNGTVGYMITPGMEHDVGHLVADGRGGFFLAARHSGWTEATRQVAVLHLDSTGARDTSFDGDGWAVQDIAPGAGESPAAMLAPGDGSVLVTGSYGNAADDEDGFLLRLGPGGTPDASFDGDGRLEFEYSAGLDNHPRDLDLGLDGSILVTQEADVTPGDGYFIGRMYDAQSIPNYSDTGAGTDRDWSSDPSWTSVFGVCLRALGGTASQSAFTADPGADCAATDSDEWYAVPATPGASAKAATLGSGLTTGTAAFRFGFRPSGDRRAGAYYAPITFTVLAPNA